MAKTHRKYWFRMAARSAYLLIRPSNTAALVDKSYDRISPTYDRAWTDHMRNLTEHLIDRLNPQPGNTCIDLTCGTGFATSLLAAKTDTTVTGVDRSQGMLDQARQNHAHNCKFVQADILEFLKNRPTASADIITCCWGLGYSRPFAVLRQIKRVLKPHGKVAIIDNSLFSLREIIFCSFLTFAENPRALQNVMHFKFLPGPRTLRTMFAMLNLKTLHSDQGSRSYTVDTGRDAIARLKSTGAAAGFEYASGRTDDTAIFDRFAQIIEDKYMTPDGIKVTHRYLAGIAQK
ncbi:ubiquinone/menaquinone biosynthesis methyltransferase [Anaerohalosphaera lusitana]|uniref:Ubiquinone/menaquinone biosynthesis methyltransferase n=1 Tax=Anaerohalosphaera lusitana TaxID=1936003 RepID=A0A1U9NIM9_9BACT|nr:methyltransferase domain-containing protein [Anaerohalosphaera lusitana]AQT67792.1 ubiquinone/menaquinone biosynthesis methyltransferase [Anaerohalosphaera lusitana]